MISLLLIQILMHLKFDATFNFIVWKFVSVVYHVCLDVGHRSCTIVFMFCFSNLIRGLRAQA